MSEPIALETVLRILREGETDNLVGWAIEYGLGRHPQAAATIADISLGLAEKEPQRAGIVLDALRNEDALPKAPDFGARARGLLPKLRGVTFRALLLELARAEKDQARDTVLQYLDRQDKNKDQDACIALGRLSNGAALLTERLGRQKPLDCDPSSAVVILLQGQGRSHASVTCALELISRLPRRGEEVAECLTQLLYAFGGNAYSAASLASEKDSDAWPEVVHAECAPIIRLGDAREAAKLLGSGKGKDAVERLFSLVPKEWLGTAIEPPAAPEDESDHQADEVPVARSLLQALAQGPALREKLAQEHPEALCGLIAGAVARIHAENQSVAARPEDAGLPEAVVALKQAASHIRNERDWIVRTASFGAEALPELRRMLADEQSNIAWRAAEVLVKIGTLEAAEALAARAGEGTEKSAIARDALGDLPRPLLAPVDSRLLREALEKQDALALASVLARWDAPCPEADALVEVLLPQAERALFSDAAESVATFMERNPHPGFLTCIQQLWRPGQLVLGTSAEVLLAVYDPRNPLRAQTQRERAEFMIEAAQEERIYGRVLHLRLRCRKCGAAYTYPVGQVTVLKNYLDPRSQHDPRECCMIGDVIKCKRCAAIDEYEWTRQAEFHLRAMLVLRFAMQRNPNREAADKILAQCAVQLARAHTEIGDNLTFGEAIAKLKDRVAGEPDNPDWRQRLGNSYFHSRQHTLALATYAELLARWPRHSDGWLMRGQVYARLDRHEEALNDFIQAALTLDPKAAKAPEYATSLRFELLEQALAAGKPVPVEALAALSHIKSEEEAEEQASPKFAGRRDEPGSDEDDYYEDEDAARPVAPLRAKAVQVGPNDRCPCGSGKKYKKCCGR